GRREAERSGLECRILSPDEARAFEPALRGPIAGAIFFPQEAHVDPLRYVRALGKAAANAGADIQTNVEGRALDRLRAKTVVVAAGVWTATLAGVPVTGGKGYHVDVEAAAGDPRVPVLLQEARSALTPLDGRLRLAGLLEITGLDERPNPARVDAMRRAAAR